MNELLTQAEALDRLLRSDASTGTPSFLAEAVLSCSIRLIEGGEARRALSLIELSRETLNGAQPSDWQFRLEVTRIRALLNAERSEECLAGAQKVLAEQSEFHGRNPEDVRWARVYEAASLWNLSRVEESAARLKLLRGELLAGPDSAVLSACTLHLSSALLHAGDRPGARRSALEALVSARRAGTAYWESLANYNLCVIERQSCRWALSEEHGRDAVAGFEYLGNSYQLNHAKRTLAITLWKRGKLDEALADTRWCVRDAKIRSNVGQYWYSSLLESLLLISAGDFSGAERVLCQEEGWRSPNEHSRASLLTTEFLGDVLLEQAEAAPALALYEAVWPKAMALVPKGDIVAELRRRKAECYLLMGKPERALNDAKEAIDHCRELGDRYEEAATYRVLGLAAAACGKTLEAKKWFDQGFAIYDDIETPYEWAKLWMSYGDWLSGPHAGDYFHLKNALEAYVAASDYFERIGAKAKLKIANAKLEALLQHIQAIEREELPSSAALGDAQTSDVAAQTAVQKRPQRRPRRSAEDERRSQWAFEKFGIITCSRHILDLLDNASRLAPSMVSILILGESGTGKELVAGGMHRLSGRKGKFVPVNCSAMPDNMVEDELFGHVAGAFTGANRDKPGLVEECDGGTVFLDEIGEMSVDLQAKLLRFLESGESRRIGSNENIRVSTRVLAATNRERAALESGDGFRTDLFYRLAHAVYVLPPLRKRPEDVEVLLDHFVDEFCSALKKTVRVSESARERMLEYPWPGNVRQLRTTLQKLIVQSDPGHVIRADELQLDEINGAGGSLLQEMESEEKRRIREALEQANHVKSDAARMLRMARTTLLSKMKRYGLS